MKFEFVNGGRVSEAHVKEKKLLSKCKNKAKAKRFTMAQLNELLDIHENTYYYFLFFFANRIENLKLTITSMQEENKQMKGEVKPLQDSTEFQNEKKERKDMTEEKQKLETNYRSNKEMQNLIQQITEMKEQTTNYKTDTDEIIYEHQGEICSRK